MLVSIRPILTDVNSKPTPTALRQVAEFLASQNLAVDVDTVTLAQHFPRYVHPHMSFEPL